ncbi:conserved hypothetical protein [Solidesulfovibrio fructosivorans JJ]]|uniref:DUF5681 domain-containing protein n=1 Tax=Solidesulfovibrio fructosivorans JJ] TaxID=596151 RepID=E1JUS5_SOLFR|nr:DUF5681 domain-containing protein [Solidesulfovibrio fructosivorans]EFL51839.1 conserved hypothetical protein [Solidesulfovibrio fructosivorans JJ]]
MAESPLKKQPKQRGAGKRFEPGQSGNPAGKPKGCRSRATMAAQALIDGKGKEVVEKALDLALAGDGPVLRAILDRLCPVKRDAPVSISLPSMETPADLPKITGAIMQAAAEGKITPSEAAALAGLVEAHRKAIETAELSDRIAKLEERSGL